MIGLLIWLFIGFVSMCGHAHYDAKLGDNSCTGNEVGHIPFAMILLGPVTGVILICRLIHTNNFLLNLYRKIYNKARK